MKINESIEKYGEDFTKKMIELVVLNNKSDVYYDNRFYEDYINAKVFTRRTKRIVTSIRIGTGYDGQKYYRVSIDRQSGNVYVLLFTERELREWSDSKN